jgi:hypothetical protein
MVFLVAIFAATVSVNRFSHSKTLFYILGGKPRWLIADYGVPLIVEFKISLQVCS